LRFALRGVPPWTRCPGALGAAFARRERRREEVIQLLHARETERDALARELKILDLLQASKVVSLSEVVSGVGPGDAWTDRLTSISKPYLRILEAVNGAETPLSPQDVQQRLAAAGHTMTLNAVQTALSRMARRTPPLVQRPCVAATAALLPFSAPTSRGHPPPMERTFPRRHTGD
jgi:hypothetical protein